MTISSDSRPLPLAWRARAGTIMIPVLILALLVISVAGSTLLRQMFAQALGQMRVAPVLAVLPVQAAAICLCSLALWWLKPGVSFLASFESRLLRDAGNAVLLILPGLGEAIGTRMMVLAGGSTRAAVSVRALDILAETLGQLPYLAIALMVLARIGTRLGLFRPQLSVLMVAVFGTLLAVLVVFAALAWRWARGPGARHRVVRRLFVEARLLRREIRRRHGRLPLAVLIHVGAWGLSGMQIWLAARLFGLPLDLFGAIAIESAASAVRVILFFIPAGLVMQEAGIVGAGLAFGLAPPASLALALVLRLRDMFFGLALLWWPLIEFRARRKITPVAGGAAALQPTLD